MKRSEMVLAALAPGQGALYSPVQVQKLLFLLDTEFGSSLDGPLFAFTPYNYGPFDKGVYEVLEALAEKGLVFVSRNQPRRTYNLTSQGQTEGSRVLESLPPRVQEYFRELSEWVRSLSFSQLVSAVYKAYPEMRVNSVFQG